MAVATTNKLLIYRVPTSVGNGVIGSPSKGKKQKQKQKAQSIKLADLENLLVILNKLEDFYCKTQYLKLQDFQAYSKIYTSR